MEDALAPSLKRERLTSIGCVLILVLMEDALAQLAKSGLVNGIAKS